MTRGPQAQLVDKKLEINKEEAMRHNKTAEEYAAFFHPPVLINLSVQMCSKDFNQVIEEHMNLRKHYNTGNDVLKEQYAILNERLSNPRIPDCETVVWYNIPSPNCTTFYSRKNRCIWFFPLSCSTSRHTVYFTRVLQSPPLVSWSDCAFWKHKWYCNAWY